MESRIINALSEKERNRLAPYFHPVELHLNQQLVEAGDLIASVYFLRDCVTSTIVDTAEGATIEVGLMGAEGMVGVSLLLGRSVSNTTVIVQMAGSAIRMSADDFRRYVVEPRSEMFELLLHYADAFIAMVAQTAACNSVHSVEQRLARWILMTHDHVRRDEFSLTQEFLAYMLGVRRPSVSLA